MRRFCAPLVAVFGILAASAPMRAQRSTPVPAPARLQLTVDSIMRGPDSRRGAPVEPALVRRFRAAVLLVAEARREGGLALRGRTRGGTPKRLSDEDAKAAPPVNGRWDTARKRLLGTQGGDIFIHDPAAPAARIAVTRTSAPESSPRWARNGTHVTYVREGNLFIVPVQPAAGALVTQLTDVGPKRAEPRLTDSQKFLREEEEKLIGFVREQRQDKQKAEEKARPTSCPSSSCGSAETDLMLSSDDTHVFILVGERPASKSTIVPNYVTESGYTEDIPARQRQQRPDRRLLAVLNLKTGKSVWADGSFAPPVAEPREACTAGR